MDTKAESCYEIVSEWSEDGVLTLCGLQVDGKPEHTWITFAQQGNLWREVSYSGGKKHGWEIIYGPRDQIQCMTPYRDGNRHGEELRYSDFGVLIHATLFVDDEITEVERPFGNIWSEQCKAAKTAKLSRTDMDMFIEYSTNRTKLLTDAMKVEGKFMRDSTASGSE